MPLGGLVTAGLGAAAAGASGVATAVGGVGAATALGGAGAAGAAGATGAAGAAGLFGSGVGLSNLLSAGVGVGSSLLAGGGDFSFSDSDRATFRRPIEGGLVNNQLQAQAALFLGADPQAIAEDFLVRQIGATQNPANARFFQTNLAQIRSALAAGNVERAQQVLDAENASIAAVNGRFGRAAAAALSIENGRLIIRTNDPAIDNILVAAQQNPTDIIGNRTRAFGNLSRLASDFPAADAASLEGLTEEVLRDRRARIDERFDEEIQEALQTANAGGFNPAGILKELSQQRQIQLENLREGSIREANTLLGARQNLALTNIQGIQSALDPNFPLAAAGLQNSINIGVGNISAAQQNAVSQLSAQSAQGQAQGQSDAVSSIQRLLGNIQKGPTV